MRIQERYQKVIDYFSEAMPTAETELDYRNTFELLVAVMLSAQCTDKRVNMVTPTLFEAMPTPEAMAASSIDEIFALIRSVSYPNSKAKHLQAMAQMLINDFGGEVPSTIEELQRLPGVGRKTANVVVSVAYDIPAMPVDTHVYRVSHRLGLALPSDNTPRKVEDRLTKYFPKALLGRAHHWLILHGRYVCIARKPKCAECGLSTICPSAEKSDL